MDYQSIVRRVVCAGLLLLSPVLADAMEHFVRPLQDQNGRAISGASVSVYIAGSNTLATIYSDNAGTVKSNPITTGIDGMMDFYAANGLYDLSPVAKGYVFNVNQYKRLTIIDPTEIGGGPPGSCIRTVSGTADTILASDSGCIVVYTDTGIVVVTLPQAGAVGFGTSFNVTILNLNATQVIVIPTNSTIQTLTDLTILTGQSTDIRSDGSNYYHAPGVKNDAGWPLIDTVKEITWATSESSAESVGDGTRKMKRWCDATDGCIQKPDPIGDTLWRIWPNFSGIIHDEENNSDMVKIDPDAIGTGSGTVTMQTGQQLVLSNLGVEFNESDTNPSCSSGKYTLFADTSDAAIKACVNGALSTLGGTPATTDTIIYKASDETVNNSTTFQNDNDFVFSALANSTYALKIFALYDSSTIGDFKYDFTIPAGASGRKATQHVTLGTSSCSGTSGVFAYNDITATDNNVGGIGTGTSNTCSLVIEGTVTIGGTAGNIQWRWAQAATDATNTVVRAGSWMSYRKVSP